MTVTLHLSPEMAAGLVAKAQAEGLSVDQFLTRKLQTLVAQEISPRAETAETGPWERTLDEWLKSFPPHSGLSEDALKRENWYADRW